MPIYAYRCSSCGHAQDVLQKMSDPVLRECPACGAATYVKQVTAAGFQLKGSGWYVTDFKGDGKPPAATPPDAKPGDAPPAASGDKSAAVASEGAKTESPAGSPAPAPSPNKSDAPAPAASAPAASK